MIEKFGIGVELRPFNLERIMSLYKTFFSQTIGTFFGMHCWNSKVQYNRF